MKRYRGVLIFLLVAGVAAVVLGLHMRKLRAVDPWANQANRPKTPEEELAAVQGPDLLDVHKRANMTVSERRKLLQEQERQKQILATPDEAEAAELRDAALDTPEESRQRIEFAPFEGPEPEKDDDYDELL